MHENSWNCFLRESLKDINFHFDTRKFFMLFFSRNWNLSWFAPKQNENSIFFSLLMYQNCCELVKCKFEIYELLFLCCQKSFIRDCHFKNMKTNIMSRAYVLSRWIQLYLAPLPLELFLGLPSPFEVKGTAITAGC